MCGSSGTLNSMSIVVCPGSFDPVTLGHLDVFERCARLFKTVHVVVAKNAVKTTLFSTSDRIEMIRQSLALDGFDDVIVTSTSGLITQYCREVGANIIVRGLRQNGDYYSEMGMALVNRKIGEIETMFLPADPIKEHISSSVVKDVAFNGGDIRGLVPDPVISYMEEVVKRRFSA